MISDDHKQWIDNATYKQLLERWRFAPAGDSIFQGETGQYYSKILKQKQSTADHVATSKDIGWKK